ncbi:hypothetical protein EJ05DRAFT_185854 [Pseudovirgaria hyperparasitica]|uniref:BRCT domain-containing protein n=1 Tax=Pseudovirgaria hyperparasitica TaxID=470096 RepID=A0A6A6WG90_9PEZI|nr:uncharacterized protein EJ05DRAFT_185854 [Pseudovirgaria hyperparasitica]KAF2761818.1 hypothetical protein EJ05DRAFT_185854 [Pseudovirgaria hyperparasitica]
MAGNNSDTIMEDPSATLFKGLRFAFIPSTEFSDGSIQDLRKDVVRYGGDFVVLDSDGRIQDLSDVSHVISTTADFPQYSDALDAMLAVVKPAWIPESIRKQKPANTKQHSPDPHMFMSNVVVCCADIPEGDKEAVYGGVLAMGGAYATGLSAFVTHIIALDLRNAYCQKAIQKKLRCHIVLPHWFDVCMKVGAKVSEDNYLLSDPVALRSGPGSPPLANAKKIHDTINGATSHHPEQETVARRQASAVFKSKKLKICKDLELSVHLTDNIAKVVEESGGSLTDDIEATDILICRYRDGPDYVEASRAGKDVGNLAWLFDIIRSNRWRSPFRKLLHYPVPRNGIPGFDKYHISISNYTGLARDYLQDLVKVTGAHLDRKMTQEDTHLITAYMDGAKCEAAQEWNIHILNHIWLEESYAQCEEMSMTNPKYVYFPKGTNLGEAVGQTSLDPKAVEKYYTETAPPRPGVVKKSKARPAAQTSTPVAQKTRRQPVEGQSAERHPVEGDKENQTPSTAGRGAKARAMAKLSDMAPDMAKFEKEMKRVGGVIHGRDRKESEKRKRSVEPDAEEEEEERKATPPKKTKSKQGRPKAVPVGKVEREYWLMVTGYKAWVGNETKESADKMKLRQLGLWVTGDPRPDMILCAPNLIRTKNFLRALAHAPVVVSTDFLDYALKHHELPDPHQFILSDRENEKKFDINLTQTLTRAQRNQGKLLEGLALFCTGNVTSGYETMRDIAVANGGTCQLYTGRSNMNVSKREVKAVAANTESQEQDPYGEGDKEYIYLISSRERKDELMWPKFRSLAKNVDMIPRIVDVNWLLKTAMDQKVSRVEKEHLIDEKDS